MKKLFPFIILLLATVILTGCIPRLVRPDRPSPHFTRTWEEREVVRPIVVAVEEDRVVVVEERERVLVAGVERVIPPEPPVTLMRRIGLWIAGISVIYIIIALVVGPGAVIWLITAKIKVARRMRKAVIEIVEGVKQAEIICLKEDNSSATRKVIDEVEKVIEKAKL